MISKKSSTYKRSKNEIGNSSIRGGDTIGDHTILYADPGEKIELKHQAYNREYFTDGAIKAIKFIMIVSEDKIYTTQEVLNL